MNIIQKDTPNYTEGRDGKFIKYIVIHWIGQGTADSTIPWFANPASQVSAHYLVSDDTIYQFVDNQDTAWHAGNWTMNCESIGIEHVATPDRMMSDSSYETSGALVRQLSNQYGIPLDRDHIIGHREVKATQCPGTIDIDRIIQIAKEDTTHCEDKIEELEQELSDMRDSRDKWRTLSKEQEKKIEEQATTIGEKNQQIESLNESNAKLNESNARLNEENTKLTAKNQLLTEQLTNKQLEVDGLKEELEKCQAKVFSQGEEISKLKDKLKKGLCGYTWMERWWSLIRCKRS